MEIVKVCNKHGNLIKEQCYFTKRDNLYYCKECKKKPVNCRNCNIIFSSYGVDFCSLYCRKTFSYKKRKELKCKKHNILKTEYAYPSSNNIKHFSCHLCKNENSYKWKRNNPDKSKIIKRISDKKYHDKNREILIEKTRLWTKNNRERKKEADAKYTKYARENLSDSYILQILGRNSQGKFSLPKRYFTKEFVEAKRLEIKLKRKLKEIRDGNK